jgi:serine/threonine protein kinase
MSWLLFAIKLTVKRIRWAMGIVLHEMLVGHPPFSVSEGMDVLFDKILHQPLRLPSFLSPIAANMLESVSIHPSLLLRLTHKSQKKLLERNVDKRLGSGPRDGEEIKEHAFYKPIDWDKLIKKEIPAPFIPRLVSVHGGSA